MVIPRHVGFDRAEQMLHEKSDWIQKHLARMQQHEAKLTTFTPQTPFRTHKHELRLQETQQQKLSARISKGVISVSYPEWRNVQDPDIQQFIRQVVEEAYRLEAKAYLPQRVAYFAQQFGLSFNKVTIKKASTRWGSCSATNNINLNLHLMRLPQHLCDYVILHELAHTVEKNHGPRFWALLDKISGNARGLDQELKAYRISIF